MAEIQPSREVRFWTDRVIMSSARKGSVEGLVGDWLTDDVQASGWSLLRLLDGIEAVRSGRAGGPYEESGNAWFVVIDKDKAVLENHFNENFRAEVPLEQLLSVMRAYWDQLSEARIEEGRMYFLKFKKREPVLPW